MVSLTTEGLFTYMSAQSCKHGSQRSPTCLLDIESNSGTQQKHDNAQTLQSRGTPQKNRGRATSNGWEDLKVHLSVQLGSTGQHY